MIHTIAVVSYPHQLFMKETKKSGNEEQFHHLFLPFSVVQAKLAGGQQKGSIG